MKITHLTSATQLIQVGETTILTDPWYIDGEYYGSWHHAPPYVAPLVELVYDYVYVSHIHPDHFSTKTFERLPRGTPVLIHKYKQKFLRKNLEAMGFLVIELDHDVPFQLDGGQITIFAADNCNPERCSKFMGCGALESKFGSTQIDSLALFEDANHTALNVNDCPFSMAGATLNRILKRVPEIDLLLVGYAGAGPFPQCFEFGDDADKEKAAEQKKMQFLAYGVDYIRRIKPKYYMPFAGTYVLGGRLCSRNKYRGMPSLGEAGDWIKAHVKEEGIDSRLIQLDSLKSFDLDAPEDLVEFNPWSSEKIQQYADENLADCAYDFDGDAMPTSKQLAELLHVASRRFFEKKKEIGYFSSYVLVIFISETEAFLMDMATNESLGIVDVAEVYQREKYVTISLDPKLLFRLLSGPRFGHWNNAEIGSHLTYERKPGTFERALHHCICFLHV